MYNRLKFIGFFIISTLIFVTSLNASTVLKMDLEGLVEASDLIVVGTVASLRYFEDNGRILTSVVIEPDEVLKGTQPEKLEIVQYGGKTEEFVTVVPGMPVFSVAEHVLLFLEKPKSSSTYVVTGMSQGKFKVTTGPDGKTLYAIPSEQHLNLIPVKQLEPTTPKTRIQDIVNPLRKLTDRIINLQK